MLMTAIDDPADLRALYAHPKERSLRKVLSRLDQHCIHFISLSPFCVLGTASSEGIPDLSPRGGAPGFVQVLDERTLVLPDRPGNNRLDSLSNLAANPAISLLFLVPGVDETLRVHGTVEIVPTETFDVVEGDRKPGATVLQITVRQAFFHCAKALMRSHLWSDEAKIDRETFPTLGQILKDQLQDDGPVESHAEMVRRYSSEL
jgi:PPOX class probable FMN-dependent enzyme